MTTDLTRLVVEDGVVTEEECYEISLDILRGEIAAERQQAKDAGHLWTPWRRKKKMEMWVWCCDDYHRTNHKRKEQGIYVSYATQAHTMTFLCERCLKRNPLQMPNKHWMRRYLPSGYYTRHNTGSNVLAK